MAFSKRYYSLSASSLLESVIALCIISVCLYFTVLIFAVIFTPKTSAKFYATQNRVNQMFYELQLGDSLVNENKNEHLQVVLENETESLKKAIVNYKDSTGIAVKRTFYVQQ